MYYQNYLFSISLVPFLEILLICFLKLVIDCLSYLTNQKLQVDVGFDNHLVSIVLFNIDIQLPNMLVEILSGLAALLVFILVTKSLHKSRYLPPGPRGLPLLGYLPWLDPEQPYKSLTQLVAKYGSVFTVKLGAIDCVVVADNKIIKELFTKDHVAGRPPLHMFNMIMEGRGIIFNEGDNWKEQRKFAGTVMRRLGLTGTGLTSWLSRTVQEMMDLYQKTEGQFVDPLEIMSHVVGNMMNQAIFSMRYSQDDKKWKYLQQLAHEGNIMLGKVSAVNFLPFLSFWPPFRRIISQIK